jgi:hypothetical protein
MAYVNAPTPPKAGGGSAYGVASQGDWDWLTNVSGFSEEEANARGVYRPQAPAAAPAPAPREEAPRQQEAPPIQTVQVPTPGPAPAPAPAAPTPAPVAAPAPSSGGGTGAPSLQGLSAAIARGQSGPVPGWADDPALAQTAGDLGTRSPGTPMGVLSSVVQRRGRFY